MSTAAIGDWATAVAAAGTIGLLIAAVWAGVTAKASVTTAASGIKTQIDVQRTLELRRRVYELLSRFYSQDFTEAGADLGVVLREFEADPSKGRAAWEQMSYQSQAKLLAVLNFYELTATEYNANFLDRDVANKHLAYLAVATWEAAHGLVALLREADSAYFQDWQRFYERYGEIVIAAARSDDEA